MGVLSVPAQAGPLPGRPPALPLRSLAQTWGGPSAQRPALVQSPLLVLVLIGLLGLLDSAGDRGLLISESWELGSGVRVLEPKCSLPTGCLGRGVWIPVAWVSSLWLERASPISALLVLGLLLSVTPPEHLCRSG